MGPRPDPNATSAFPVGGPKLRAAPRRPLAAFGKNDLEATAAMNLGDDLDYNFDDSEIGINLEGSSGNLAKPASGGRKNLDKTLDFDDIKLSDSDAMGLGSSEINTQHNGERLGLIRESGFAS